MIAFRLDANSYVATGHMYRCIAIAKQCQKKGHECMFLLADDECTDILHKAGFNYYILNLKWDDWDYGINIIQNTIVDKKIDCLVVDSYKVTENFFSQLNKIVPIFYLDDLCKQKYDLSAVLHYSEWENENILADIYNGTKVKIYAGMKYMPLREVFSLNPFSTVKKYCFLITTGGSDPFHITLKLLTTILEDNELKNESICAVLGKLNTDREKILTLCKGHENITILQNISNMDEVMHQSDFAVTAGGTSVYELMASGVPFVCFGFSQDQQYFGEKLELHGNAAWAGDARDNADTVIKNIIEKLKELRKMCAENVQRQIKKNRELIDGHGAERVANIIIDLCKEKDKTFHGED